MSEADHRTQERLIVLVVDDNPAIRDMVSWALELDGNEPVEASDGTEALAWMYEAAREKKFPDVILLDLAMPRMDGRAFLHELRTKWVQSYPMPVIVVITAGTSEPDAVALKVDEVILKPFHVRQLLDVVRRLNATRRS